MTRRAEDVPLSLSKSNIADKENLISNASAHMWARWSKMEPFGEDTSLIWYQFGISARCIYWKRCFPPTAVR